MTELTDFIDEHFETLSDEDQKTVIKALLRQMVETCDAQERTLQKLFSLCERTGGAISSTQDYQSLSGKVGGDSEGPERLRVAIYFSCACMDARLGEEDVYGVIDLLEAAASSEAGIQILFRRAILENSERQI